MYEIEYLIGTLEDVKKLIAITTKFEETIDITQGKYNVDGKSIMGVLSLDLTKAVTIKIVTENIERAENFFNKVSEI